MHEGEENEDVGQQLACFDQCCLSLSLSAERVDSWSVQQEIMASLKIPRTLDQ